MNKSAPPLAVIAGPTASGKSALAIALAQRTNGVIVNADSAQVYADLRILSARPAEGDMGGVEHRLFGTRDGADPCSAAEWAREARQVVADVHRRGQLPILVGGTGLYLRTLLDGIADVPPVRPEVRAEVRGTRVAENHQRLAELDPAAAARLHAHDTTRVGRALEVVLSSGIPLAEWQQRRTGGLRDEVALTGLVLLPPRDILDPAIDDRFVEMVEGGAIDEVERLLARDLPPALPVMRAIGVAEIAGHLRGEASRAAMIAAGQLATRQYAKRQLTWFRHQQLGLDRFGGLGRHGFEAALEQMAGAATARSC